MHQIFCFVFCFLRNTICKREKYVNKVKIKLGFSGHTDKNENGSQLVVLCVLGKLTIDSAAFNTDLSHSFPLCFFPPPRHPPHLYFDREQVALYALCLSRFLDFKNNVIFKEKGSYCFKHQILTRSTLRSACRSHGDLVSVQILSG